MKPLRTPARLLAGILGLVGGFGAAAALAWGGYQVPDGLLAPTMVLGLAVGWSFIAVGTVAWSRRPDNRTGLLMVMLGFAWLARFVVAVATPFGFAAGVLVGSVYLSLLVHLLLAFPTGRLATWPRRCIVLLGYLLSAPLDGVFLLLGAQRGLGAGLPPNGVVIAPGTPITGSPELVDIAVQTIVVTLFLAVLSLVIARWLQAGGAERRSMGPGIWGGAVIILTLLVQRVGVLLRVSPQADVVLAWSGQVVLIVWPLALLFGLLRSHLDRSAVGGLIVELGTSMPQPDRLRAALGRALHDPSVALAYWLPEREAYVDAHGNSLEVSLDGGARAVTFIERDGARIAALVHDAALAGEPELVDAVVAGAGLALENERLHAEIRSRLREVSVSRARIVEASDAARRKVERDLHDGAQQGLAGAALALRLARKHAADGKDDVVELLDEASLALAGAVDELRKLAHGIYPTLLRDAGLGPALDSLAQRSPVPVVLTNAPDRRFSESVEHACYFVVSEALANVAKHADATQVVIDVRSEDGHVAVEIADDGVGGADVRRGSGLRGLTDRVAALDGRLQVNSPLGEGTRIIAELPCG